MTKTNQTKTEIHFEQATVFARDPIKTIQEMKERGYNPIIG
jgi:hypothetical protein